MTCRKSVISLNPYLTDASTKEVIVSRENEFWQCPAEETEDKISCFHLSRKTAQMGFLIFNT